MSLFSLGCLLAMTPGLGLPGPEQVIRPSQSGTGITRDARIAAGNYELAGTDDHGAIEIATDDVVVDFQGATLLGAAEKTFPDRYTGRGLVIRARNVTIKNARIRGYKVGIYAEDAPGLTLVGCDVSNNYRQHLGSTLEREDLSDWLYGHDNDENEWLRYGAGIYLLRCDAATVSACRARAGQNGLCLVSSDRVRVVDNDFSFMSGWGLAMWRSSACEVFNNKLDWCMRGYSHGVYARGQDSTGILVYEQCHDNLFAYNSATHGGDGFFLFAGNETVERTGHGGCNRNVVFRNDFSHAAANGIEATFSNGNLFIENTLDECAHGVWAGYSYETVIERNVISRCRNGVSIEHGRDNFIADNRINDTELGVHLWWDDDKDLLATAFGKAHGGCPSLNNRVFDNRFGKVETGVRLRDDTASAVAGGIFKGVATSVHLLGNVNGAKLSLPEAARISVRNEGTGEVALPDAGKHPAWTPIDIVARYPRLIDGKGSQDAFLPEEARRGRKWIFVDDWGPYDFTDVRVFPREIHGGAAAAVAALGPGSTYRIVDQSDGVRVLPPEGTLPVKLAVEALRPGLVPFSFALRSNEETRHVTGTLLRADWKVSFYGWNESDDPRKGDEAWRRIVEQAPLRETTLPGIDFQWYHRAPADGVPADHFATVATTRVALPAGTWRFCTVSDDGVRVLLDGKAIISNWTWHGPTPTDATVKVDGGEHDIRIEHFEIDGYAMLSFSIAPTSE